MGTPDAGEARRLIGLDKYRNGVLYMREGEHRRARAWFWAASADKVRRPWVWFWLLASHLPRTLLDSLRAAQATIVTPEFDLDVLRAEGGSRRPPRP